MTQKTLATEVNELLHQEGGDGSNVQSLLDGYRKKFIGLLESGVAFEDFNPKETALLQKLFEYLRSNVTRDVYVPPLASESKHTSKAIAHHHFNDGEIELRQSLLNRLKSSSSEEHGPLPFWHAPLAYQDSLAEIAVGVQGYPVSKSSQNTVEAYQRKSTSKLAEILSKPSKSHQVEKIWITRSSGDKLYLTESNARDFFSVRQTCLNRLFTSLSSPRLKPNRRKRRVGIILPKFAAHTETYVTLPFLANLNPEQYETFTFVNQPNFSPQEAEQRRRSEHFHVLPPDISDAVKLLRSLNLDIAVFASNLSWATNLSVIYAHLRVAPIQIATSCCPTTTGLSNMDYMLSGRYTEPNDGQSNYTEKLLLTGGPAHAFDLVGQERPAPLPISRRQLGLREDDLIFISGANALKITREYMVAMIQILKRTPRSKLILYPFNPNWSDKYNTDEFLKLIEDLCVREELEPSRIKVLPEAFPDRRGVLGLLRLADVYLDSFFHSGATSAIDPLLMGTPIVTHFGKQARSRQALALLKCLQLEEFAHDSVDSYIQQGVKLGTDPSFRQKTSHRILTAMTDKPKFLDPKWFSSEADRLFQQAIDETLAEQDKLATKTRASKPLMEYPNAHACC